MKECLRCGGSAYRDFAYGCDHQFWDDVIPEPAVFLSDAPDAPAWWAEEFGVPCARGWGDNGGGVACRGEQMHVAWASLPDGKYYVTYHPTREGARQLWREQYAIGLMVDSLFRKLTGWAKEGAELRAKREWVPSNKTALAGAIGEWMHANGKAVRKPRADAFDLRKLEVYPENPTGGDHLEQVREAIEFTRKPYAVWCAEQEEKAAAALVGKRWVLGSKSWTVTRVHPEYPKLAVVAFFDKDTGHTSDPAYDPAHLLRTVRELGAVEVTSEQGLDVVHDHAMSGTPKVPAGWPDNRTPEEKAAALVGRTWMSRGVSWHVTATDADGGMVEVCRCEGGRVWREWHSPMRLTNLFKAVRAVEVTSE